MKGLLAIAACVALLWAGTASAAAPSNVVIVTIMGAGIVKIEGHTYSDVRALSAKLAEIRRRKPPQDIQIVAPPGTTAGTLAPATELLLKAIWSQKTGRPKTIGEPPMTGFLIEPRPQ